MPARRRERLARESSELGEQAALLHLDGHHERALAAADRAVDAQEEIYKADEGDDDVRVFATRLRDRAEIRREWGMELERAGSIAPAIEQYRRGVKDAKRAIQVYGQTDDAAAQRHPLWVPAMLLLLAEMCGWSGSHQQARKSADTALAAERVHLRDDDESSTLSFALGLSRYADLVAFLGDEPAALAARRESVALTRSWLGEEGELWSWRHSQGTTWVTTPTLERFCRTAYYLALGLEPPTALGLAEALLALQDAAEGYADLVPTARVVVSDEMRAVVSRLGDTTFAIERWLQAVGEEALAQRYADTFHGLHQVQGAWSGPLRALRPALLSVADRYRH